MLKANEVDVLKKNICIIEGDGIGPEITAAARDVLLAVGEKFNVEFNFSYALMGGVAVDNVGVPLPDETIRLAKESDAVLLGAVGGEKWDSLPADLRPEKALLGIRKELGLFANIRPAKVYDSLKEASPLKNKNGLADLVIVRELTGGIYFGEKFEGETEAYDVEKYFDYEIERILICAFDLAMLRRKKLCMVDKANVLSSSRLWRKVLDKVKGGYPEVEVSCMYVDNAAMQLAINPSQFDVLVTSNIFGDILSDLASALTGSIGMLPSASMGDGRVSLYEPIHGSAPDIAGKGIANPLATILSVAMMLRSSFLMTEAAELIENAVEKALDMGLRTKDLDSENFVTTKEMTDKIIKIIKGA